MFDRVAMYALEVDLLLVCFSISRLTVSPKLRGFKVQIDDINFDMQVLGPLPPVSTNEV